MHIFPLHIYSHHRMNSLSCTHVILVTLLSIFIHLLYHSHVLTVDLHLFLKCLSIKLQHFFSSFYFSWLLKSMSLLWMSVRYSVWLTDGLNQEPPQTGTHVSIKKAPYVGLLPLPFRGQLWQFACFGMSALPFG